MMTAHYVIQTPHPKNHMHVSPVLQVTYSEATS
jgi:hypothetical protein